MAFRWRADDGPTLNAGLVFQVFWTSIAKKPYIVVIFVCVCGGGGGSGPPVPSLDPPMKRYLAVTAPPLRIATILTTFDQKFSLAMEIAQTFHNNHNDKGM